MGRTVTPHKHGTTQLPDAVSVIEYDADGSVAAPGTTLSVSRDPLTDPENRAGGAGSTEIGPTSMR